MIGDFLKNVVTTIGSLDPRSHLIETVGNAVGLDPKITQSVKMAFGIATFNFVVAAEGGIKLLDELSKQPPKTEYTPSKNDAVASSGYAPVGTTSHASSIDKKTEAFKLDSEKALAFVTTDPAHQGLMRMRDNAINCGPDSKAMKDYITILKAKLHSDPTLRAQFENHFNIEIVNAKLGASNEIIVRKRQNDCRPAIPSKPSGTNSSTGADCAAGSGNATGSTGSGSASGSTGSTGGSGSTGGASRKDGPLDPNILEYQKALEILLANFETYDTARGVNDDLFTRGNLNAILDNPNASDTLKKAAKFLLDHPEYYDRLEMAAGIGGRDGIVGKGDVKADLAQVKKDIATYGIAGSGSSSGSSFGGGGSVGDAASSREISTILNDPNMSIEEKINAILLMIADRTDDAILDVMKEMEANSAAQKKAATDKSEGGQAKAHELQSSQEKLNLKLQQLMEKRKQMFDLLSNFSTKFNEMAKTAIQNMARA